MLKIDDGRSRWTVTTISSVVFLCGLLWQHPALLGGGAVALCLVVRSWGRAPSPAPPRRRQPALNDPGFGERTNSPTQRPRVDVSPTAGVGKSGTTDGLVEEMLSDRRYGLLLHPETSRHLRREQIIRAIRMLDDEMALVPAGRVLTGPWAEQDVATVWQESKPHATRAIVTVEATYLNRFTVTNREFQRFVDAGGYEEVEFWPEEALPALLDFVDETGNPGPRFWSDGRYLDGSENLPVVGVCWYEACAYARWQGKRLPTDAEWTKAGAWPVESAPGRIAQRRYPWGDSFDVRRANLWGAGRGGPVGVDEFAGGTSVGGISQLVGNVWEWTATPLAECTDPGLHVPEVMKSIRGGAFDTYFENQATCHFQSGEFPLSRRANIGFRLAIPMDALKAHMIDNVEGDVADDGAKEMEHAEDECDASELELATC